MSPRAHLAIHDPSHRASIRGPIEAPWPLCVPKRSDHDRLKRGFSGFDLVEDTMLELGRRSLLSARARAPGALFGLLLELSLQPLHAPLELDSVQLVDALVSSTEPVQLQAL